MWQSLWEPCVRDSLDHQRFGPYTIQEKVWFVQLGSHVLFLEVGLCVLIDSPTKTMCSGAEWCSKEIFRCSYQEQAQWQLNR